MVTIRAYSPTRIRKSDDQSSRSRRLCDSWTGRRCVEIRCQAL